MKVLVIGGAGFIGQHTVRALANRGCEVVAIDNNCERLGSLDHPQKMCCDITDLDFLELMFRIHNPDAVLHLAAQSSVAVSMKDWAHDARTNILGTINVVECCKKYGVKRIVYAGSGGTAYGNPRIFPTSEQSKYNPLSPYGVSKLAGEFYVALSGINCAILRYANVYGPGQPSDGESGVISIFIGNILEGKRCLVFGDGEQTRDFVYVGDLVEANIRALERECPGAYNISSKREVSLNEIIRVLSGVFEKEIDVKYLPVREGETRKVCLDNMKAEAILQWQPMVSLEEGIKRTVEYMGRAGQADKPAVSCTEGSGSTPEPVPTKN